MPVTRNNASPVNSNSSIDYPAVCEPSLKKPLCSSSSVDSGHGKSPPDFPPPVGRNKARSLSESCSPEGQLKGILKCRSRTVSERQNGNDFYTSSELPSVTDVSTDSEEGLRETPVKTVRFDEHVQRQLFRANASILGRRNKNQKKAEKKRRAVLRRLSESDAVPEIPGGSQDADVDQLSRSLESVTIKEEPEETSTNDTDTNDTVEPKPANRKRNALSKVKRQESFSLRVSDDEEVDAAEMKNAAKVKNKQRRKKKRKNRKAETKEIEMCDGIAEQREGKVPTSASYDCDSDSGTSFCDQLFYEA